MKTIFIGIASFLDYELKHTIIDCILKAKHPDRLAFGLCVQYDPEVPETEPQDLDLINLSINNAPIRMMSFHYEVSEGGCWARNKAQQLYGGEDYSLQVDSHTRFIQNWDVLLEEEYKYLQEKGIEKPLISFLPPPYHRDDGYGIDYSFKHLDNIDRLNIPIPKAITSQYWLKYIGYDDEINTEFKNYRMVVLYGGFVFTDGQWVVDVRQDPEHYYTGEELALAIRSFTHGYDIFAPKHILAWHRMHPKGNEKHFTKFGSIVGDKKHMHAMGRLKMLIEGSGDLGKYGAGSKRTVDEYMEATGLNFHTREIEERQREWI